MSSSDADRNLLFGVLAMQMDFIGRDDLIVAVSTWVLDKSRPLETILSEKGFLDDECRELLKALVQKHLEQHENNTEKSLAAISSIGSVREDLQKLDDADIVASLQNLSVAVEPWDVSTIIQSVGQPTSDGGRFRVIRPHASGGLGTVSIARDEELHRDVALKEIQNRHADNPNSRARFLLEAEITGGLEHPGIVPVYGLGQYADGRPYYAMRFIHGDSLRHAVKRFHQSKSSWNTSETTLELRKLLGRFVDVCNAIEYAHSRGILHRDLKPGNIMLGNYGETLVVDWGLAKTLGKRMGNTEIEEVTLQPSSGSGSAPTQMGSAIGTPQYMSPEQAAGRIDELGPASDVYSLGATLYFLLTGQSPFADAGNDIGPLLKRVEQGEFQKPRDVDATIPKALEAVCLKAMANAPDGRYASPHALANDVERWMADEPVTAWREPLTVRTRRWIKRHRTPVVAVTTAAVLLIAALTTFGVLRWNRLNVVRHSVDVLVEQGIDAAQVGDFDRAIANFSEASGLCRPEPSLKSLHRSVSGRLQDLEKHRQFLQLSKAALREGIHALRTKDTLDPLTEQAEQALAVYGGADHPNWDVVFSETLLTDNQIAETKSSIAELLNMVGIRLAMFNTKDEAGRQATRRALKLFDTAEQLKPPSAGIWMSRMLFNRRLGNDEAADRAGERFTKMGKSGRMTAADFYLIGIMALRVSKDPKRAIEMFYRALAKEPNNFGANFGMYLASEKLKDYPEQIRALSVCLSLRPNDVDFYYFRGFAYFGRGQYELAHLDFGASIERDANYKAGYYWRGRTFVIQKEWKEAEQAFSHALEIDPEFVSPYSWRALARGKLGLHRGAAEDAEKALQLDEGDSTRWKCARTYAQSLRAVLLDADESDRQILAKKYGDRGIELLHKLADGGYFTPTGNLISLLSSDLDPLRDDERFRKLKAKLVEPLIANPNLARSHYLLILRSNELAERGEHADAARSAERLYQLALKLRSRAGVSTQRVAGDLYDASCCISLCVPAVARTKLLDGNLRQKKPDELTEEEKATQAGYRDRAIDVLAQAIQLGFTDVAHLKADHDLDAVRNDPRFRKLIEQLEKANKTESDSSVPTKIILARLPRAWLSARRFWNLSPSFPASLSLSSPLLATVIPAPGAMLSPRSGVSMGGGKPGFNNSHSQDTRSGTPYLTFKVKSSYCCHPE